MSVINAVCMKVLGRVTGPKVNHCKLLSLPSTVWSFDATVSEYGHFKTHALKSKGSQECGSNKSLHRSDRVGIVHAEQLRRQCPLHFGSVIL